MVVVAVDRNLNRYSTYRQNEKDQYVTSTIYATASTCEEKPRCAPPELHAALKSKIANGQESRITYLVHATKRQGLRTSSFHECELLAVIWSALTTLTVSLTGGNLFPQADKQAS